ncbi:antirestriction protein ArdA [Listeria booriae]|uniref:Antirestriction protein ArdA n=2 Tax=Listeria booriae TaxID=1552123 RepID=A0A841ZX51_9LIST|nr:antirestriction protein ArdA [Listeria booriae]
MEQMQVYIVNLGKYNEGISQGAWFNLPVAYEVVAEKIGLNKQYEEYAIHDYEAPFKISEFNNLDFLNRIANQIEEKQGNPAIDYLDKFVEDGWYENFEDALDGIGAVHICENCSTMQDVAIEFVESQSYYSDMPSIISFNINYEAVAKQLADEGYYYVTGDGIVFQRFEG